ncbi:MAG: MFS transporter [Ktedonobacterales bacterium]
MSEILRELETSEFLTPQPDLLSTGVAGEKPRARRWGIAFGVYAVASNLDFTNAIWLIYLASRGYNPFAIGLFEMVFHIAKFFAEVPTGVFADLVGRRASLILSCVFGVLSAALFLAPVPALVVLAMALAGISWAFKGGAQEAALWTLAERAGASQQARRYSQLFSRFLVLTLIAAALGEASGGYFGHFSIVIPYVFRAVTQLLAVVPLFFIPALRLAQPEHGERPRPLAHALAGLHAAWRNPTLLALLLISALEGTVFTTVNFYTQLAFNGLGFTLTAIGVIFGGAAVMDFLATMAAPRLIAHIPRHRLLAALIGVVALGLFAMGANQPLVSLLGFLLLFHVADAIFVPTISTSLNERTPETQRATVLSLETGMFSLTMIAAFPLFGLGLTSIPYSVAYLGGGVALLAGVALIVGAAALLRRSRRE